MQKDAQSSACSGSTSPPCFSTVKEHLNSADSISFWLVEAEVSLSDCLAFSDSVELGSSGSPSLLLLDSEREPELDSLSLFLDSGDRSRPQ